MGETDHRHYARALHESAARMDRLYDRIVAVLAENAAWQSRIETLTRELEICGRR